ncbi:MAG: VOC family protein [Ignavibacteria bacterium]|nr:VOC family protein [Ignavibacteria bacterium]
MKKVTSIGGIFFKCKEPQKMNDWYHKHLGFETDAYGSNFEWRHADNPEKKGFSVWGTFKESTDYFQPSDKQFMFNFRVENLEWLLDELKKEGIEQIGETQIFDYGKFAHIMDLEGNKIELWEPVDEEYEKMLTSTTK